ncbi:MAG: ABC transporter permease, partial [Cytophagales bacterium]|nr:ABC transporter permease [Cytophagales bacterium]
MIRNYLKVALRNLRRHQGYSFINIAGLSGGMTVAILIGLWLYDELSYDKSFPHHDRIAQVLQHRDFASGKETWW